MPVTVGIVPLGCITRELVGLIRPLTLIIRIVPQRIADDIRFAVSPKKPPKIVTLES